MEAAVLVSRFRCGRFRADVLPKDTSLEDLSPKWHLVSCAEEERVITGLRRIARREMPEGSGRDFLVKPLRSKIQSYARRQIPDLCTRQYPG